MPVPPAPVPTGAKSWLLMDYDTGQVLAGENIDQRMEPASITKVMTSYVLGAELKAGRIKNSDSVMMSENAWRTGGASSGGSTMFAELNSKIKVEDLIRSVIIHIRRMVPRSRPAISPRG